MYILVMSMKNFTLSPDYFLAPLKTCTRAHLFVYMHTYIPMRLPDIQIVKFQRNSSTCISPRLWEEEIPVVTGLELVYLTENERSKSIAYSTAMGVGFILLCHRAHPPSYRLSSYRTVQCFFCVLSVFRRNLIQIDRYSYAITSVEHAWICSSRRKLLYVMQGLYAFKLTWNASLAMVL